MKIKLDNWSFGLLLTLFLGILIILAVISLDKASEEEEIHPEVIKTQVVTTGQFSDLSIVEIGGCEYVLWDNSSSGSDLEHHGNCKSESHNE